MTWNEVRDANEAGRAVAVLSPTLDVVHWANTQARALLDLGPDAIFASAALSADHPFRESFDRLTGPLAEDGEASLRLRTRIAGQDGVVTAHVFLARTVQGLELAVLGAGLPGRRRESREALAERLFAEAGDPRQRAILVDETSGVVLKSRNVSTARAEDLAELAQEFAESEETLLSIEEDGEEMLFARLASDLVLVEVRRLDAAVAEGPAASVEPVPEPPVAPPPAPVAPAMRSLIDRWNQRLGPEDMVPAFAAEAGDAAAAAFVPDFDRDPVRFVWQIDPTGCFRFFSPEFAEAVGPSAADVVGRPFAEVAERFGFDESGDIGRLMSRRDTWSGRSVHWPIEGSARRALVDLAALPIYDSGRAFQGFRGFGIVRLNETVEDAEARGLTLAAGGYDALSSNEGGGFFAADELAEDREDAVEPGPVVDEDSAQSEDVPEETPVFGRRRRALARAEERRPSREKPLSSDEENAFRAIGAKLTPVAAAAPAASEGGTPQFSDELATLFAAMPIAALLQVRETPVHASREFFALTGYASIEAFARAGGLDALFVDEPEVAPGECVALKNADGERLVAKVQMQRVTLSGRSSLAFFFTPIEAAADDDEPDEDEENDRVEDLQAAISELTIRAASLSDEVDELQAVLDTATDGILLLDQAGRVRSMNGSAEALLGLSADDYRSRPFSDLLAPESRPAAIGYLEMLRDGGLAGILNDGREVLGEVAQGGTVPLFITIGHLSGQRGWCVVMRDIAHWKRIEEELVQARRQAEDASLHKSRFLANISHELRTPLNAIIGFADVMASECFGPIGHERYLEYLGDIKRSGHHVLDLVNDLLDISKIEAGKVELNFEAVSLNEVVSEVVSLMQPQANRERVIVRSNLPENVPLVVADRRSVRQIALNLIANAIRFTPAGGQIIASTSYAPTGEVALRFRDSGIGMTEREIEIALTPFRQVQTAGKERHDGTGLGLPLTKAMTEANRAQFSINSAPGEGTVIEIVFPPQRVLAE